MEEPIYLYVVGTAGSGKSHFTAAFARWCYDRGISTVTVNLDPGAETLPYEPDVDIRDWIMLSDVMEQYQLGPNGAQVVAADLVALKLGEIQEVLESFRGKYVIVDTPGQTELFVFREAGRIVMETLSGERSMVAFLVDPFLAKSASAFVTQLMLSATAHFRFRKPIVNVLTKADLLKEEEMDRILHWANDTEALQAAFDQEPVDSYAQMNLDISKILEGMGTFTQVTPTSSETLDGMDDVYAAAQNTFWGGEDAVEKRDEQSD